jgi:hypothetical protein
MRTCKDMLSFLRIRIPRFEPEREVNKWLPIKLTLRQNNGFCKGREDKSLGSHTQNNGMNLTLKCSIG